MPIDTSFWLNAAFWVGAYILLFMSAFHKCDQDNHQAVAAPRTLPPRPRRHSQNRFLYFRFFFLHPFIRFEQFYAFSGVPDQGGCPIKLVWGCTTLLFRRRLPEFTKGLRAQP